jgi:hypothetical protein
MSDFIKIGTTVSFNHPIMGPIKGNVIAMHTNQSTMYIQCIELPTTEFCTHSKEVNVRHHIGSYIVLTTWSIQKCERQIKLTCPQWSLLNKFLSGKRITKIIKGQSYEYRFTDSTLCDRKVFYNLLTQLYGIDQPFIDFRKYFTEQK